MNIIRSLYEDVKAWRRGETRVAPRGITGRVYVRKDGNDTSPGLHKTKSEPLVTVEMKIIRADGTVETRQVPGVARYG